MDANRAAYHDLAEDVLSRVRRSFPDDAPREIVFLGQGDFCTAFLLDGHLVARVGRHAEADSALRREASLLPHVGPLLSLAIPSPALLPQRTEHGHVIALHEQIAGREFQPELWRALPAEARGRCTRELADFLSRLHGIEPGSARAWGADALDHGEEARVFRGRIRSLSDSVLPATLRRRTDEVLARYQAGGEPWSFRPALVHGDLSPGHVLLDPTTATLTGVIDWGDARVADPARDFVYLYEDWGSAFLDDVLQAYALERPSRIIPRIHLHFVIVHVDWLIEASRTHNEMELAAAAATLDRALDDLDCDLAGGSR